MIAAVQLRLLNRAESQEMFLLVNQLCFHQSDISKLSVERRANAAQLFNESERDIS